MMFPSRRSLDVLKLLSTMLFATAAANAATLASYDMENTLNRALASLVDGGVTATSLTGNSLAPFGALQKPTGNFYTTWITTVGGGSTVQDALTAAQYMHLTVTPLAGQSFTLSSLSFDIFAATGTTTSFRQIYVFSDKTGFADGDELLTGSTNPSYTTPFSLIPFNTVTVGQNFSIDLSGFAAVNDSVTFRIYFQTPNAAQGIALDNLTVSGAVVPEPSALAVLGLGVIALLTTKRSRSEV